MHMNIYVCFSKFEYFMHFLGDWFFWSDFFFVSVRFRFLGLTSLMIGPVLITLAMRESRMKSLMV